MDTIKQIVVKVIPSNIANDFIKKHHYSGKVVNNSQLHFGCFLNNVLHGVLSYGCPLDKRKVLHLVLDKNNKPALWNEMLELNRMAFDEVLPKYSESRCIGITLRLIKKNAPHIRWILSFADGTHCGDGTIYRASNFKLTGISSASIKLGTKIVEGYQLRYIYVLDPNFHIAVPIIPFEKIDEIGAGMYKGEKRKISDIDN